MTGKDEVETRDTRPKGEIALDMHEKGTEHGNSSEADS